LAVLVAGVEVLRLLVEELPPPPHPASSAPLMSAAVSQVTDLRIFGLAIDHQRYSRHRTRGRPGAAPLASIEAFLSPADLGRAHTRRARAVR
jgi:hypothetical protein